MFTVKFCSLQAAIMIWFLLQLADCLVDQLQSVICDPLSENPALRANIEFELEAILSVQVVSQLNSDYYTVSQGAWTVSY